MSNRITIECHACGKTFTKLVPQEERKGEYLFRCPYSNCKIESKIVFEALDVLEILKSLPRD